MTITGDLNRTVGWSSLVAGAASGILLGLWSFDGPVEVPRWLGEYPDTSRRLVRLGHIAFFGVGILNILLSHELARTSLGAVARRIASVSLNLGNVFLPLVLIAAGAVRPVKYLLPVPALCVLLAVSIAAAGAHPPRRSADADVD